VDGILPGKADIPALMGDAAHRPAQRRSRQYSQTLAMARVSKCLAYLESTRTIDEDDSLSFEVMRNR